MKKLLLCSALCVCSLSFAGESNAYTSRVHADQIRDNKHLEEIVRNNQTVELSSASGLRNNQIIGFLIVAGYGISEKYAPIPGCFGLMSRKVVVAKRFDWPR